MIVRLEKESFQVLTMEGKVQTMKHTAVTKRRDNRFAMALDSENNNIQKHDVVRVVDGVHSVGGASVSSLTDFTRITHPIESLVLSHDKFRNVI